MGTIFYTCKMFPFKILGIVFIKIYVYPAHVMEEKVNPDNYR